MKAKDLRNSILQMAVQGKLVPQDPNDEPASVLLERIRAERTKLIKEKKIKAPKGGESFIYRASDGSHYEKRGKGEPVCIDDEIPFEIPESWEWARLESAYNFIDYRGKTPTKIDSGVRLMTASNIRQGFIDYMREEYISVAEYETRQSRGITHKGDILFTTEAPMGFCALNELDVCSCGQRVITFQNYYPGALHNALFCQFILSPAFQTQIAGQATGTTAKGIKAAKLKDLLLPVPPRAEQVRIEARITTIAPLIDQYGALESAREHLDADLPDRLRKSVLQLAVQGKLVEQDPNDEPASALLERIRTERAKLVKEKKLKTPKGGESVIYRASDGGHYEKRGKGEPQPIDVPFDIPDAWEWARVSSVFDLVRGSGIKRTEITILGEPCVRYGELYTTYQSEIREVASHTTSDVYDKAQKLLDGEVVATLTGENDIDIGRAVVNMTGKTIAFGGDLLALKGGYIDGEFAMLCFNSPYMGLQRTAAASGNIIVHLSADKIGGFLMAIPPKAEQRRIVAQCRGLLASIG